MSKPLTVRVTRTRTKRPSETDPLLPGSLPDLGDVWGTGRGVDDVGMGHLVVNVCTQLKDLGKVGFRDPTCVLGCKKKQ